MSPDEQLQAAPRKPDLRPPGAAPEPETGSTFKPALVWGGLSVVVVLVLLVLLVLPKLVSETTGGETAENPDQKTSLPAQQAPAAAQESTDSRALAEQALQDFLHARARLELANAPAWGEPEWSRAIEGAAAANDLFAQRQFAAANEGLVESLALLQSIESGKGQRMADALDAGWQSLQEDDSDSAIRSFETALSIEADNESALEGLERARVRPALLKLMADGGRARSGDDLQNARQAFLEATELDPAYEPASIALFEVTGQITDLAFTNAMSEALRAMEARQIKTAELALREAARLKPNEPVVSDTQHQLTQLKQKIWLTSQREEGLANEQNERWSQAVSIYRKVLSRVPQAAFAREGLARAQDRERLHQQLDHYISDPTRVWSEKPRENATKLLEAAGKPPAAEPRLVEKTNRLETMIIEATTPQNVILQSDGLTQVSIYHVGRLGQFTQQQLELRPGVYTVVGSRAGYRDVRQTLTVKPGSNQTSLDIRCEEPI